MDLTWYAIHPIELLYTIMGPGCETVTRTASPDADVIVGQWKGGRLGTVRAIRPYSDYGAVITRGREVTVLHPPAEEAADYHALVAAIVKFFETGRPAVPNAETLEIFAFMDDTAARCYSAIVERGLLAHTMRYVPARAGKVFVVTTADVWRHQGAALAAGWPAAITSCSTCRAAKSRSAWRPLEQLAEEMVERGADRSSVVIAFGGGIVTDMAGFLAAIFMRGIPVIQIPTTLLAQVDAAIGGKTGVNLVSGKNLIGSFHQPLAVLIDPDAARHAAGARIPRRPVRNRQGRHHPRAGAVRFSGPMRSAAVLARETRRPSIASSPIRFA